MASPPVSQSSGKWLLSPSKQIPQTTVPSPAPRPTQSEFGTRKGPRREGSCHDVYSLVYEKTGLAPYTRSAVSPGGKGISDLRDWHLRVAPGGKGISDLRDWYPRVAGRKGDLAFTTLASQASSLKLQAGRM